MNISLLCEMPLLNDEEIDTAEDIFSPPYYAMWETLQEVCDHQSIVDREKVERIKNKIKNRELDLMSNLQEKISQGANRLAEKIINFEETLFKS